MENGYAVISRKGPEFGLSLSFLCFGIPFAQIAVVSLCLSICIRTAWLFTLKPDFLLREKAAI